MSPVERKISRPQKPLVVAPKVKVLPAASTVHLQALLDGTNGTNSKKRKQPGTTVSTQPRGTQPIMNVLSSVAATSATVATVTRVSKPRTTNCVFGNGNLSMLPSRQRGTPLGSTKAARKEKTATKPNISSSTIPSSCQERIIEIPRATCEPPLPSKTLLDATIHQTAKMPMNSRKTTTSLQTSVSTSMGIALPKKAPTKLLPATSDALSQNSPPSTHSVLQIHMFKSSKSSGSPHSRRSALVPTQRASTLFDSSPTKSPLALEQSKEPVPVDIHRPIPESFPSESTAPHPPSTVLPPKSHLLSRPQAQPITINKRQKTNRNNDNFVRLNLRNAAGACHGARDKRSKTKSQLRFEQRKQEWKEQRQGSRKQKSTGTMVINRQTGIDPVDDYVDGALHPRRTPTSRSSIPLCTGHQQPCKLLMVKKSGENKGRKFYCCSLPRADQCDHFQWADDTPEAAQRALLHNKSKSGFIARQVASYMERVKNLTVPELVQMAKEHGLRHAGKKQEILTRLSIWVRNEVATAIWQETEDDDDQPEKVVQTTDETIVESKTEESDTDSLSSSESSDDSGELEIEGEISTLIPGLVADRREVSDEDNDKSIEQDIVFKRLKELFSHSTFRDGQEWAIRRCIAGERTLLVAPTGFGKSLCYALTASVLGGVTIVVSPLISLIQDQLRLLPPRLPAATLSGNMSAAKTVATIDDIVRGRIKVLFVSPERLVSASFCRLFRLTYKEDSGTKERRFPTVSLLCVDEAHCLSQWGHNFRPSYLRLRSMVDIIQPQSILAITATAGPRVVSDICETLHIPCEGESSGVRLMKADRNNIDVRAFVYTQHEERLASLVDILSPRDDRKEKNDLHASLSEGNVIVYVWRQHDADATAEYLLAFGIQGGIVVYHGGMSSDARAKAQSRFIRGKARICVATVAFGMGINKSDVRGVVHLYLSASPEHYLQEIGRAGRDGEPALALALILEGEVLQRHSLSYTDLLAQSQIDQFLTALRMEIMLSLEGCPNTSNRAVHVALPLQKTARKCGMSAETLETLLSLLERMSILKSGLRVEGYIFNSAQISERKLKLETLAHREDVVRAIQTCGRRLGSQSVDEIDEITIIDTETCVYEINIANCANYLGMGGAPRHVFAALRRLETERKIDFKLDSTERCLHLIIDTNAAQVLLEAELEINTDLCTLSQAAVFSAASKVLIIDNILDKVKDAETKSCRSTFQRLTAEYLTSEDDSDIMRDIDNKKFAVVPSDALETGIVEAVNHLVTVQSSYDKNETMQLRDPSNRDYLGLTITKFLHGITPPGFQNDQFRGHPSFGTFRQTLFTSLLQNITDAISNYDI